MGRGKLAKFDDMAHYANVFDCPYSVLMSQPFAYRGKWHDYFGNDHPIIVELGCGKGEYTVSLAQMYPERNFIGVDIKGARMWTGATHALAIGLTNVAFVRTNIELLSYVFAGDEVSELWLTFSDPQMKHVRKRLTSTFFLSRYRAFLRDHGIIHVKTDSQFLFTYTSCVVTNNHLPMLMTTTDLHHDTIADTALQQILSIRTYYEQMWMDRGIAIKYLSFALPHDAPLTEPQIDIPTDDYRSYHRHRRSPKPTAQ